MKRLFFSILLAGTMATVQAAEPQCGVLPNAILNVHDSHVYLTIKGQNAKDIFDEMPESSKLSPKESCYANTVTKLKGGFMCEFATDAVDPICAYRCHMEVSAKTGKTAARKKNEICGEP